MATARKHDLNQLLDVMLYDDSSSDCSSSSGDDDLDFLFLDLAFAPKHNLGIRINLLDIPEEDCELMFRFQKIDIECLEVALNLPKKYVCSYGTTATGIEALLILLRRLTYPNRWCDLVGTFGRAEPELSTIFNTIIDDIHNRFAHLLQTLNLVWLDCAAFANAIHVKGAPLTQCWGFIDGTARPIARPSVEAPNGLIANMFGPIEGRRHDAFLLSVSGLEDQLKQFNQPNGDPYVIYGDPAYGLSSNILAPFRGAHLTQQEQELNKCMSAVRTSVE